jgi:trigger factor
MQVSVESFGVLGRRMTVAVSATELERAFSERLRRLSRQVKMPGFRPGKVPLKMVEAQYGPQLLQEAAGELIQSSLQDALGRQGLRPAGGPKIVPQAPARGRDLQYIAEFEVYPEIRKLDIAGVRIERPVVTVADADVDSTLDTIRRQRTTFAQASRPAQSGDRLLVDFVGRLDSEAFEGGSAQGFPVVLGSGTLLPDLEQGLIGAGAGETRTLPVRFPVDYRHPKLAGRTAEFEIKVVEVSAPQLPEVNADFARQLGVADGDVARLRADVRGNLEREAERRVRGVLRARALQALLDANRFDVPQALVAGEVARLKGQDQQLRRAAGADTDYQERARQRVALWLILSEIIRARGLHADPARVRAKLEELAGEYEKPEEFLQWHRANPERMADIETLVVEERVVEELLGGADVVDQPMTLPELLKLETA